MLRYMLIYTCHSSAVSGNQFFGSKSLGGSANGDCFRLPYTHHVIIAVMVSNIIMSGQLGVDILRRHFICLKNVLFVSDSTVLGRESP